ncbi:MAG: TIGR02147 family protein [bacterium]
MKGPSSAVSVFHYLDYRKFLRDWYQEAKASRGSFSFRTFSKRAGFQSTNFFKLVMDGDRNLTEESISKFTLALKLNKQEQEFFRNLVFFNQAKTNEQKSHYYAKLLQSKKYSELKPIEKNQYEYYSAWYHPVIRELAVSKKCDGSPDSIARQLSPEVSVAQVERSLQLLESLGFIQKTSDGRYRQASPLVSTGAEVASLVVFNYHKLLLSLCQEVMDQSSPVRRDVSTMTLGIAKGRIPQLKKKIQEFRQEVLKLVADDAEPDEVVQLNIQLFPLTQDPEAPRKDAAP